MKILMAAPFEANGRYKGGIGSVVNTMLQHKNELDKYSIDIIKFNTCIIERPVGTDEKMGFANIKNSALLYTSIIKKIKIKNPDVLYYHTSTSLALLKDLLIIRHAKRKTKIKTVVHIHAADYEHIMMGNSFLDKTIIKLLKKYANQVVFLSKETMKKLIAVGLEKDVCDVIYNFNILNLDNYGLEKLTDNKNPLKLLFVGLISEEKGIFDLTEVIYNLKDKNIELHICGKPFNKESEQIFNDYRDKLGDKLIYHGFVSGEEKDNVYKNADILVLPSYEEGLPIVILEAFASGCAVISTDVGAIPEILGEKNGIIINPGDKEALEEAILYYINDPLKLVSTQKENMEYAKKFTCEEFIRKMSQVCEKAVNQ